VRETRDANGAPFGGYDADEPDPFGPATTFDFQHKVFAIEGGYFAFTSDKTQVVYYVPLGTTLGAVPLPMLRSTFEIRRGSHDDRLLGTVESSLRFVKVIRPGESIPRELLDGTASWQVSEEHRALARNRLSIQLASWVSGHEIVVSDPAQIEQMAEDPITKQRVAEAYVRLTERLGWPPERQPEVEARIGAYAHELAYIEALRGRMALIRNMVEKIERLRGSYRHDRAFASEIIQMMKLFKTPLAEFSSVFDQIDGQSGEILALMKNLDSQIAFTRRMRDELHHRFLDWDELIDEWQLLGIERSTANEGLVKKTYRFLAQRYLTTNVWRRV
jgi:hypothetical protein